MHNYMLIPVPYVCMRESDSKELNVTMHNISWEPMSEEIEPSQRLVDLQAKRCPNIEFKFPPYLLMR